MVEFSERQEKKKMKREGEKRKIREETFEN